MTTNQKGLSVSDPVDIAQAHEEELRQDALAAQARRTLVGGDSALVCEDCWEPIPDARRKALPGVQTCIDCQQARERGAAA